MSDDYLSKREWEQVREQVRLHEFVGARYVAGIIAEYDEIKEIIQRLRDDACARNVKLIQARATLADIDAMLSANDYALGTVGVAAAIEAADRPS